MAITNLKTAVNLLFEATEEKGYNALKESKLVAAKVALAASIASDNLTAEAEAVVLSALNNTAFAIQSGQLDGDAGVIILSEKVFNEPLHTAKAYELAVTAAAMPEAE